MSMADTCRVCLCGRRRLHAISKTLLQETWEKLTNAKFNTNDGKSLLVCYICCAQLRKSHQFMKRALEADKLLTAIVNSGSEQSQNALLLIARQRFGFDYKYAIEHQYHLDCKQFVRNTVEEIKKEKEGESEVDNVEWSVINIKEEKEDSSQEDNLDNADVESDTPSEDDTLLKQILEREVRIVLERIDIGTSTRNRTIIEIPQNVKRMKLDETTKDRNPLINAVLENFPKNNSKASYKSFSKKASGSSNVKCSKNKQNIKSLLVNCQQVNNISPEVNIVPKHKIRVKNVMAQDSETPTSKGIFNNAENETFKQCLPKNADPVAPSTSLYGGDEEKQFSCHICQYKSVKNSDLKRHLFVHTGEKTYICDYCDYRCSQRGRLEEHVKYKHTKEKNFSCNMCQYKGVTKRVLNVHLRKHTGEKPYKCDICDYRCSQRGRLEEHVKYKHIKEKNFSCNMCQYQGVTKSNLNVHLRTHTVEKPYNCDLCDYRCSDKSNLIRHIKCKHTNERNISCHLCEYKCVAKSSLNVHLRKHTGEKPYKCDLCDYRCSRKYYLTDHLKSKHTKEKNFSCHLCQYKCVAKSSLNIHLHRHTGEKPYICDLCDYRCLQRGALERHIKYKHTGEKPYICDFCDYRCSERGNLETHIKCKHTNERNFSCHLCQYKCVAKSSLNIHLRKHTGEKPYKCDLCDYRCSRKYYLTDHIKSKHTKEEELLMSFLSVQMCYKKQVN